MRVQTSYINTAIYRELQKVKKQLVTENPSLSYLHSDDPDMHPEGIKHLEDLSQTEMRYEVILCLIQAFFAGTVDAGINEDGELVWALSDDAPLIPLNQVEAREFRK